MANTNQSEMKWMPIESAPEGVNVLITYWAWATVGGERMYAVAYMAHGAWFDPNDPHDDSEFYPPTHWSPLPPAPQES